MLCEAQEQVNQEDKDDTSPPARSTQDTLISTSYKESMMCLALKVCDTLNGVLVSKILNINGGTQAERWDGI